MAFGGGMCGPRPSDAPHFLWMATASTMRHSLSTPDAPHFPPSLLQVGDTFVLNCLGEDDYAGTMRHFLKRFAPGGEGRLGSGYSKHADTRGGGHHSGGG